MRRLVVSWISVHAPFLSHEQVLDNKPGIDMLEYFPQLMEGLFLLLGDERREIRVVPTAKSTHTKETDDVLQSFLSEIKSSEPNDTIMNSMVVLAALSHVQVNVLLNLVHHNDGFIRLTVVTWIYEFVLVTDWSIPYARLFRVLLPCYADTEKEVQEKAQATCWELLKSVGISLLSAL